MTDAIKLAVVPRYLTAVKKALRAAAYIHVEVEARDPIVAGRNLAYAFAQGQDVPMHLRATVKAAIPPNHRTNYNPRTPSEVAIQHRQAALDGGARRLTVVLPPEGAKALATVQARHNCTITEAVVRALVREADAT